MRMKNISVRGLFGYFNHDIPLHLSDRITIITSPNGFGKTMILRIVNALFNQSLMKLTAIPFQSLTLIFDDDSMLEISRNGAKQSPFRSAEAVLRYSRPGAKPEVYEPKATLVREDLPIPVDNIEDVIAELDQIGPETWRQLNTGETLTLEEVLERYADDLTGDSSETVLPDWLISVRKAIPVRFISTDRLYATDDERPRRTSTIHSGRYIHRPNSPFRSEPAVERYSQELRGKIRDALARYGALSQSLDRTFPARLVAGPVVSGVTIDLLRKELAEIEERRKLLVDAGLLPEEPQQPALSGLDKVDDSKLGVLAAFARDAEQKLGVFEELFRKVDIFRRIINSRFLHKRFTIGQFGQYGYRVDTPDGGSFRPSLLSSGEQHELVILYELLFHTAPGSMLLIDEPEISLHVDWQRAFLGDLGEMARLSEFDALVATHSPQIIGDRADLMVELSAPVGLSNGASTRSHSE
jgi:energy-coupling factor transporter ATP-binding protein EcfA2